MACVSRPRRRSFGEAFKNYDAVLKARLAHCAYQSCRPRVQRSVDALGEDRPVGGTKPTAVDAFVLKTLRGTEPFQ
jgi:hypothetical protein